MKDRITVGYIGLGRRGLNVLRNEFALMKDVYVKYICDLSDELLETAHEIVTRKGGYEPIKTKNYKDIINDPDVDAVVIMIGWSGRPRMAMESMRAGKYTAIEVGVADNLQECYDIIKTYEETGTPLMMLENCCYDEFELCVLNMAQQGKLGEIIHAEGSYLHDLRERIATNDEGGRKWSNWQVEFMSRHNGNPYPTHGLGPVALAMGINRDDRMDSIVSCSSKTVGDNSLRGNMNSSIITTEKGHTILVQHCITLPRPYSRSFLISGTEGFAQKYPVQAFAFSPDSDNVAMGEECNRLMEQYRHPFVEMYKQRGEELCGRRWIDYAMDCRLIHCLRNGLPLDMNVYDAALWSCLVELTDISASNGGTPVEIPDFTRGQSNQYERKVFS